MADLRCLEEDAKSFAYSATTYDQQGHYQLACFYYREAARALLEARQAGSEWPNIEAKADEYLGRAEVLKVEVISKPVSGSMKTAAELGVERAKFLVDQALDEDSAGNVEEAFKMYTEAADLCIQLRNETRDSLQTKVTKLAELALERAEALKSVIQPTPSAADRTSTQNAGTTGTVPGKKAESSIMSLGPLGLALKDDVESSYSKSKRVSPASGGGGGGGYTTEEINVLRITSSINNEKYVPFLDVDANEKFAFPVPFTDKHGMLALSPKQRDRFSRWVRPEQLCSDTPQVIYAVSSWTIRQTIVSDCSFVASLAIAAQYERRFNKKLITSIIYPQNRRREPQYNPCGKYMVKLNINGVPRKVIIDDFLPMGKDGNLLCSFSTNRNELWVSLLEKAYMKVMGGYDFPGSNSNIDLHALTGWIPERVAIHRSRTGSSDDQFNPEREFKRILDRFHQGHCLITVATGEMSESVAERAGLVPTHAYAMLDVRQIQGCQLFQLKNPWRHLRWRGNYSETDTTHWTESLKKALNYDPKLAEKDDDGVFWIDYKSIQEFFDVFYINWNPELFPFTTCYHHMWTEGPKKDSYSIGHNPQYRLEVKSTTASAVWILLTRHITNKDDFADNKEFITVLVYKTGGKRVYYPYDPPPYKDGIRINSPHYLCKMVTEPGTSLFTLVISQYERNKTIYYTLRTYGTCELKMTPVSMPYKHDKHINGEWKGRTAGGCSNHPETNVNNPMYQLKIDSKTADNQLLIELRGPKNFSVGFDIFTISEIIPNLPTSFAKKSAGDFRRGYVYLELENMSGGVYNVRPCTFNPNEESPFFLDFSCTSPISVTKVT